MDDWKRLNKLSWRQRAARDGCDLSKIEASHPSTCCCATRRPILYTIIRPRTRVCSVLALYPRNFASFLSLFDMAAAAGANEAPRRAANMRDGSPENSRTRTNERTNEWMFALLDLRFISRFLSRKLKIFSQREISSFLPWPSAIFRIWNLKLNFKLLLKLSSRSYSFSTPSCDRNTIEIVQNWLLRTRYLELIISRYIAKWRTLRRGRSTRSRCVLHSSGRTYRPTNYKMTHQHRVLSSELSHLFIQPRTAREPTTGHNVEAYAIEMVVCRSHFTEYAINTDRQFILLILHCCFFFPFCAANKNINIQNSFIAARERTIRVP